MSQPKRSIFEEVGADAPSDRPTPQAGGIDRISGQGARGAIRWWLIVLAVLVTVMILVGGLTRLTDSGLSITEWAPIKGAIPPLSPEAWQSEFTAYQQTDEYKLQNTGMTLAQFKTIFWWEWGHRQLGRFIGVVWALGFLWFFLRKQIPTGWTGRLFTIGTLIGLQGLFGWLMVASGLTGHGQTDVRSYMLALHLGTAFAILGLLFWQSFLLGRSERDLLQTRRQGEAKLFSMTTGLMHFAALQIVLGALVAGIDAGRNYTDWPLMAGGFFPPDMFDITPWWRNFFENDGLVQFIHRMSGYLLLVFGIVVLLRGRRSAHPGTRTAVTLAFGMLVLQMIIGIVTVMQSAHLHIALTHQFGAIVLWGLILRARFLARYPKLTSVREGA